MRVPQRLSDYPWVIVNLSCKLCTRRGRYRLARLAARYGPEMPLDRVLADLACDCPYWRSNPRKYDPRCGARFADLDRLRPFDLPAGEPVPRQRVPARDDLPQRRPHAVPEATGRLPMLSDWTAPHVVLACQKCGRRELHETAALRARRPTDVSLIDVRLALTADCPRAVKREFSDMCAGLLVVDQAP